MLCHKQLRAFIFLEILVLILAKANFLAEKPESLTSCKRTDSNFNNCLGKFYETVFRIYKDDFPGSKTKASIDPMHVKRVGIVQDDNNPIIQLNLNMKDIVIHGISQIKVKESKFDFDKLVNTFTLNFPKFEFKFDYDINAKLFQLPVVGNGKGFLTVDDINAALQMHFKLRDAYDHTFTDLEKLKLQIVDIKGFHVNLQNLFNGQKELEDTANAVINQNWRDFFAVLRPAIEEAVESIFREIVKKFYHYVPANYIIDDIPTSAEFYG